MKICPICNKNEADKKNVHLIPWFLIKNCVTKGGTGARDMEISFLIDPSNFSKRYTGRSILPETVTELNELQTEKENPYSKDFLICTDCEENLSRLEAIFASEFSRKNIVFNNSSNFLQTDNYILATRPKYNFSLYELLIQSIFYRCSIGNFDGFRLHPEIESKIQKNLKFAFLTPGLKKAISTDKIVLKYRLPIVVSAFTHPTDFDPTKDWILASTSKFPYFIIAATWQFQLFGKDKQLKNPVERLFGLTDKMKSKAFYEYKKNQAYIAILNENSTQYIYNNILNYFVDKKQIGLQRNIRMLHRHIFKFTPSANVVQYIMECYHKHLDDTNSEFDAMVSAFLDLKKLT